MDMIKKWFKWLLALLALLLVLLIVPFFIPITEYVAQAERIASERLGVPVKIDKAKLAFLPSPRVQLQDVYVGKDKELVVHEVVVLPEWTSLLSHPKRIKVALNKVDLKQSALPVLTSLGSSSPQANTETPVVTVSRVWVNGLRVLESAVQLPLLDVDVAMQDAGLQSVEVKAQDGTLHLNMVPEGKKYQLHLDVDDWKLPTARGDVIHHASLEGSLGDNVLVVNAFKVDMFDGEIIGNATLTWLEQWKLNGDLKLSKLDMHGMTKQADSKIYLTGRLFGSGGFDATANLAGDLLDRLAVKLDFNVKDGVLYGMDLIHAAELLIKTDSKSGQTQFDAFDGQFKWTAGAVDFNRFQLVSGLIKATGDVGISKNKMLNGEVSVALKDSAGVVAVPLEVSGPVNNPVVMPNRAAAIGAAVGTVLAPGVGTSLGLKAGEQVGKLKNLFSD